MKKAVKITASVLEVVRSVRMSSSADSKTIANRATWAATCRNQNLKEQVAVIDEIMLRVWGVVYKLGC
jgi:hypothetical protein